MPKVITHLFIHASLAVKNAMDSDSLILEEINGKPILNIIIDRLREAKSINMINIVTSEDEIDDSIASNIRFEPESKIPVRVIRIPKNSDYSFSGKNRYIEDDFLIKTPYYAFYSAECLFDYISNEHIDTAVIFTADDLPLIEPSTIDGLVRNYHKNGVLYRVPSTYTREIIVIPVVDLNSRIASIKYKRNSELKENISAMKEDSICLKSDYPDIGINKMEEDKTSKLTELSRRIISNIGILERINDGSCVKFAPSGKYWQFYPLHSQSDLTAIKNIFSILNSLNEENYHSISECLMETSDTLYPTVVDIEITNRCGLDCVDCPQTVSKRPKKDMDWKTFSEIVDTFAGLSFYLVFSGIGEPSLHPELVDWIKYAKQKKFLRVCLETNGKNFDSTLTSKLIGSGLDMLIINIDALDNGLNPKTGGLMSETVIPKIIEARNKSGSDTPYIMLQKINRLSKQDDLIYYYKRWENIVDAVIIKPYNNYLGEFKKDEFIDLTPLTNQSFCYKASQCLYILSDGTVTLCCQKFDGFNKSNAGNYKDIWLENCFTGSTYDFCSGCSQKYYNEAKTPIKNDGHFKNAVDERLYVSIIQKQIQKGEYYFNKKDYANAFKEWEPVLKYYPDNPAVKSKIKVLIDKN